MNCDIQHWPELPQPIPTDFIGTPKYFERTEVRDKQEGWLVWEVAGPYGGGGGGASPGYFIFVVTERGQLRLTVPKEVFDLLEVHDQVVVCYRKGRWTGALKGKIAR